MYLEYTLLALFLFFAVRLVFKRQGTYGLIIPTLIMVTSGYFLFITEPMVSVGVGLACAILAISLRRVYHTRAI